MQQAGTHSGHPWPGTLASLWIYKLKLMIFLYNVEASDILIFKMLGKWNGMDDSRNQKTACMRPPEYRFFGEADVSANVTFMRVNPVKSDSCGHRRPHSAPFLQPVYQTPFYNYFALHVSE